MFKSLEVKYPKFYQVFRFIIVIIASVLYAWNLRCFAKVADLLPGGFSGVSLLFQAIGLRFFYISIPFTIFNVALNIFPAYIALTVTDTACRTATSARSLPSTQSW